MVFAPICASALGPATQHHPLDVHLPCRGGQAVDDGVGDAVEAGHGHADLVQVEEPQSALAVVGQHLQQLHHVDGPEADQQAEEDDHHQPGDVSPLPLVGCLVGFHRQADPPAAEHHQHHGDDEAQAEARHGGPRHVLRHGEENAQADCEIRLFVVRVLLGDGGDVEADDQRPDGEADGGGGAHLPQVAVLEGVDHSQVAVDGDAAEQGLGGVKVGEEQIEREHAEVGPVHPHAPPHGVQPADEAQREAQVAQRQVEQVDAQLVPLPDVLPRHEEGEGVGRDGHHHDGQVVEEKHPLLVCVVHHEAVGVVGGGGGVGGGQGEVVRCRGGADAGKPAPSRQQRKVGNEKSKGELIIVIK